MNRRLDTHATAFGLAAMVTLAMLSSMNLLATQPHEIELQEVADKAAATQVIVVEAKRTTRS
jgi:hypothetical protein